MNICESTQAAVNQIPNLSDFVENEDGSISIEFDYGARVWRHYESYDAFQKAYETTRQRNLEARKAALQERRRERKLKEELFAPATITLGEMLA
jgi:hypothetical protein